jgi:prepilin signal peptidase PulO-like enzyme (type II secretory pathway)
VLLTVFLGALAGTIIFLPLTLLGRKKLVPFGVFLAAGAAITYWLGPTIMVWYTSLLGVA